MKVMLANLTDIVFLGRVMEPTNYDGKSGVRYKLMLKGDIDSGSLNCTEGAYQQAEAIPEFTKVNIAGDYSSDFRSFKISSVVVAK